MSLSTQEIELSRLIADLHHRLEETEREREGLEKDLGYPILSLAVTHRTGDLQIGDLAVVAAVGAQHRDVAFAACHALIDELKATVPIWKNQFFTGGDSEWVDGA